MEIAQVEKIERVMSRSVTPVYESYRTLRVIPRKRLLRVDISERPADCSVVMLKRFDGSRLVEDVKTSTPPFRVGQKVLLVKDGPWNLVYFEGRDATAADMDAASGCV